MKKSKNKAATIITLLLVITIALSLGLPTANAHTPALTVPTFAYISVSPNPIGVNQPALIIMWIDKVPPTAFGAYGDRWDNFRVHLTKPDGSEETLGPFTSDPVGAYYTSYTPTQIGTYKFVFSFGGDTATGIPIPPGGDYGYAAGGLPWVNDTFSPSESDPVYLTVQDKQVEPYQETPLPTQYWTRPVSGINRQWGSITGNWLGGSGGSQGIVTINDNPDRFNRYSQGPESAHIMWTKPFTNGGLLGGQFGDKPYYDGSNYERFWGGYSGIYAEPILINGVLYYSVTTPPRYGWYAVDLRTGEEIWFHNATGPLLPTAYGTGATVGSGGYPGLSFGQVINIENPNQFGGFAYLWSTYGSKWDMFDAFSGNYICSIDNVPSWATSTGGGITAAIAATLEGMPGSSPVYGKDGSILRYKIVNLGTSSNPKYYLQCWNSTQAIWAGVLQYGGTMYWTWRTFLNRTFDGRSGFSLNASIPTVQGGILAISEGEMVVGGTAGYNDGTQIVQGNVWALSLKRGQEGTLLWNITYTPPKASQAKIFDSYISGYRASMKGPTVSLENSVFFFEEGTSRKRWVYDLTTGQKLWESQPEAQWNSYIMDKAVAYGKLFGFGYGGEVIAYDIRTGKVLWNWTSGTVGFETYYQNTPLVLGAIADHKLYFFSTEHSPTKPLRRDAFIWCVDTETGELLWKIQHWGNGPAIADGILVDLSTYDNQIYAYGKGPSATTVAASPKNSVHGTSVVVEGTVTDQCAGAKRIAQDYGYVNGIAAISDEDQEAWMEYLYMQRPIPANAQGVEVTLDALDPNNNFVHLGTAKSDISGVYGFSFVPEVPGLYKIIATFAGSKSYYGSYAETFIQVDEAPSASPPIEYPQPTDTTWTIICVGIVLLIAMVVIGLLILRKK